MEKQIKLGFHYDAASAPLSFRDASYQEITDRARPSRRQVRDDCRDLVISEHLGFDDFWPTQQTSRNVNGRTLGVFRCYGLRQGYGINIPVYPCFRVSPWKKHAVNIDVYSVC